MLDVAVQVNTGLPMDGRTAQARETALGRRRGKSQGHLISRSFDADLRLAEAACQRVDDERLHLVR